MLRIVYYISFFVLSIRLAAQINYTSLPDDLELIPRNSSDKGNFVSSGISGYTGYNAVRTKLINKTLQTLIRDTVVPLATDGSFSVLHQITAGLFEYRLEVYIKQGPNEVLDKVVDDIVCGDVYIIDGQSNAVSGADTNGFTLNNLYRNQYCRAIGIHYDLHQIVSTADDCKWQRPSSVWWHMGSVGIWGLKLQHELANSTGIPSCIINGAASGSFLIKHLPSNTPSNPNQLDSNKIYDRIFKKVYSNDLINNVKAVFWYQGESDATSADDLHQYESRFDQLYRSWKQDYPYLQHVFTFQINTGCDYANAIQMCALRDLQTKISHKYPDMSIMSTVGCNYNERQTDNCHYTESGALNLAAKMLPLVKKNIYGQSIPLSSYAPEIEKCYFSKSLQICLEFNNAVIVQPTLYLNGDTIDIKKYIYGEDLSSLDIESIDYIENKVLLNLSSASFLPKAITYLPAYFYLPDTSRHLYVGPWIMSSDNFVGALSFYNYPLISSSSQELLQNYPNPFSDETKIKFFIPESTVTAYIAVYDIQGRQIKSIEIKDRGENIVVIKPESLSSGIYFYSLIADGVPSYTKRMVLLKTN